MKDYTQVLCGLGLSEGEARVFLALLTKESLTAREVIHITGLSKQMAYTVLQKLQSKGFCSRVSGTTMLFRATPPAEALEHAMKQQEASVQQARSILGDLESLYEESQSIVRPLEYIEILKDRKQIVDRFFRLISATKHKLSIFSLGPYATGKQLQNPPGEDSLHRGVDVRAIYEMHDLDEPVVAEHIQRFSAMGEKSRVTPNLPMKLAIFDESTVLCALKDPVTGKQTLTSLIIEHPDFARSMTILFDHYWGISIPSLDYIAENESVAAAS